LPQDIQNIIIESNTILDDVRPDLVVFVRNPAETEWKSSARQVFEKADCVVDGHATPDLLHRVGALLAGG
jgi:hypothetical protein